MKKDVFQIPQWLIDVRRENSLLHARDPKKYREEVKKAVKEFEALKRKRTRPTCLTVAR